MKNSGWQVLLSVGLVAGVRGALPAAFSRLQGHPLHFDYLLGDIAFLPVQVLFVTLIINQLLSNREKKAKLKKMNMVIGTFFSEDGGELLRMFLRFEKNDEDLKAAVLHDRRWADRDFKPLRGRLQDTTYEIDPGRGSLPELKAFLAARRAFLLSLLGNTNLLEHDKFTDLLWAVFHLTDELVYRDDFCQAARRPTCSTWPRTCAALSSCWCSSGWPTCSHLKHDYPYLFSLAIRTNPFDPDASPIFR